MARSFEDEKGDEDKKEPECCGAVGGVDEGQGEGIPPPSTIREEALEGRHLFYDFVRTEIERNGLVDDCSIEETDSELNVDAEKYVLRCGCWNGFVLAERELRQLADAFSRSSERDVVRKKAEGVPLDTLDADNFLRLLEELFQEYFYLICMCSICVTIIDGLSSQGGAITREQLVVLFFFCADVAIQALRKGLHRTFHRLLRWSMAYIATNVAAWVHSCGGWNVVLRSSLDVVYQVTACCAFVAVVAACVVYIPRNM